MSCNKNLLDVNKAARRAKTDAKSIARFYRRWPDAASRCRDAHRNRAVVCHIFDKSVAFRIGRRSIKSISGWPRGFKSAIRSRAHSLFGSAPVWSRKASRTEEIEAAARYFLMKSPDRVRTVIDASDRAESEELHRFREELGWHLKGRNHINVLIGRTNRRVNGIEAVAGKSKADMMLTYNGKPQFYISHKMGAKPGDFRQYGGFVHDMNLRDLDDIIRLYNRDPDSEIGQFQDDVEKAMVRLGLHAKKIPGEFDTMFDMMNLPAGVCFGRPMKYTSSELCQKAIFGCDQAGDGGPNAADVVADGRLGLLRLPYSSHCYTLIATHGLYPHKRVSGKTPKFRGVHRPTMLVMRSPSNKLVQGGFINARAAIWPLNRWAQKGVRILQTCLTGTDLDIINLKKELKIKT